MTPEEKREKLQKLKALAERGVDGEKENAAALLERLMEKWGVSPDDLGGEDTPRERVIYYASELEWDLAYYVIKTAVSDREVSVNYMIERDSLWKIIVHLTDWEYASFRALHEIMWSALEVTHVRMTSRHKNERVDITDSLKILRIRIKGLEDKKKELVKSQRQERNYMFAAFIQRNHLADWNKATSSRSASYSDDQLNAYSNAYHYSVEADTTHRFGAQSLPSPDND